MYFQKCIHPGDQIAPITLVGKDYRIYFPISATNIHPMLLAEWKVLDGNLKQCVPNTLVILVKVLSRAADGYICIYLRSSTVYASSSPNFRNNLFISFWTISNMYNRNLQPTHSLGQTKTNIRVWKPVRSMLMGTPSPVARNFSSKSLDLLELP